MWDDKWKTINIKMPRWVLVFCDVENKASYSLFQ